VFNIRGSHTQEDNEQDLKWAAIERLPTVDRMRKGILSLMLDNGKLVYCQVDVNNLGFQDKKLLLDSVLKFVEEDNENFFYKLKDRIDRCLILTYVHFLFLFLF
jgi:hypothetical protein